jgi:hypothetical protein
VAAVAVEVYAGLGFYPRLELPGSGLAGGEVAAGLDRDLEPRAGEIPPAERAGDVARNQENVRHIDYKLDQV